MPKTEGEKKQIKLKLKPGLLPKDMPQYPALPQFLFWAGFQPGCWRTDGSFYMSSQVGLDFIRTRDAEVALKNLNELIEQWELTPFIVAQLTVSDLDSLKDDQN